MTFVCVSVNSSPVKEEAHVIKGKREEDWFKQHPISERTRVKISVQRDNSCM